MTSSTSRSGTPVEVRPLAEDDLPEADRLFRLAFGTFLGMPEPAAFAGDADLTTTRWRGAAAGIGAVRDGELVGSSFASRWGAVGVVGPVTVRPDCWDAGIGRCSVKFAATRPGPAAAQSFARLLDGVEALAAVRGAQQIELGVNTACRTAYELLLQRGYRTAMQGVAMTRPGGAGYHRPDAFVLGDWR